MSNPPKTIIEVQGRAVAVLNQNSEGGSALNIRSQTSHPHSQRAGVPLNAGRFRLDDGESRA